MVTFASGRLGPTLRPALGLAAAGAVVAALLTGCAGTSGNRLAAPSTDDVVVVAATVATTPDPVPGDRTATATPGVRRARSRLNGPLTVRADARADADVVAELPPTTPLGSARVLMVLQVRDDWVELALPTRPNGSTGWVRATAVELQEVTGRITVDLSARTLVLHEGDRQTWSTPVAVGAAGTPTPTGSFFVVDRVRPPDARGPYGPFALGLSAHSTTLTEFGDGDAQIGIHGTDHPQSIGTATTHGCIRVPNAVAVMLQDVPLGTPVDIVA